MGSVPAGAARPATSNISAAGDGRGKRPSAVDTARAERAKKARAEPAKETRPVTSATPSTTVRTKAPSAPPEIVIIDDLPTAPAPGAASSPPARKLGEAAAAAGASVGGPSTDTTPSATEARPNPAPAGVETGPSAAAKETAPDAELVTCEAGLAHGAELVKKFHADYNGVAVDPEANPTDVRTGRLDQLPTATHTRLLSAATEMKSFAEGMLQKLSAADHSLLVSIFDFLWGRASAPTGCSPRDSG